MKRVAALLLALLLSASLAACGTEDGNRPAGNTLDRVLATARPMGIPIPATAPTAATPCWMTSRTASTT